MTSLPLWLRLMATGSVLALGTAGPSLAAVHLLPDDGQLAVGLHVDGAPVTTNDSLRPLIEQHAQAWESRTIKLFFPGRDKPVAFHFKDLGMRADVDDTLRRVQQVGHGGPFEQRLDETMRARMGRLDVPLAWHIDAQTLFSALQPYKDDIDEPAVSARLDLSKHSVIPHKNGRFLDPYAALDELDRMARAGANELRLTSVEIAPTASAEMLEKINISQTVGSFETHFGYLGGDASRANNIATAAGRLDGTVILPGQVMSFNTVVGHRTIENGFSKGWEIFKGEMVEGIGGGTCQVASTLHAACYLGGLDILERSPHSRPSGYITMGLDSTVVDGVVDLKIRNPYPFPVVLHSVVDHGTVRFEVLGADSPLSVTFKRDVVGKKDFKRQVRETPGMTAGKIVRKQHGIRGYTVRRTRNIRLRDGSERQEVTLDVYPATDEILLVPPGTDEADLPPLPSDSDEPQADSQTQEPDPDAPTIVDGRGAHRPSAEQKHPGQVVISR